MFYIAEFKMHITINSLIFDDITNKADVYYTTYDPARKPIVSSCVVTLDQSDVFGKSKESLAKELIDLGLPAAKAEASSNTYTAPVEVASSKKTE